MLNPEKEAQFKLRREISRAQEFVNSLMSPDGAALADIEHYRQIKDDAFRALTEIGVITWQKVQELK
ncbi:hypothetical protein [Lysobacter enzymogenes]|uniref:hypothetical protein n=1 Tax=Lysobacter enzymogenes TaxID=69 RepID=UPI002265201F|nr:hypothetical protein [Lysobacter enzymogenes]UZW61168.1 hypothetical protein BV903_002410 [Lysobacter enzymogenes]